MIKLAVFDLDGTLLNTIDDIADSCNQTLKANGYATHSVEGIKSFVGYGVRNLFLKALPAGAKFSNNEFDRLFNEYQATYKQNQLNKTKLYTGIPELLDRLRNKGVKLAVLSNKMDVDTKEVTQYYLPNVMEVVFGQRENVPIKPDPAALFEIMEMFEAGKAETVYIGDSEADVKTALNAGVNQIAVTWGFRDLEELINAGSTCNISNCNELLEKIISL